MTATATIVAAYVSAHPEKGTPADLSDLIGVVQRALTGNVVPEKAPRGEPAVPIKKSVTPDYLVCLEDGKKVKMLKRHLHTLGLTPAEYRERWGLPKDYPMVAESYSEHRSALAKSIGLGVRPGARVAAAAAEGE